MGRDTNKAPLEKSVDSYDAHLSIYRNGDWDQLGAIVNQLQKTKGGVLHCMIHDYRSLLDN